VTAIGNDSMLRAVFFDAAGTLFEPREPVGVSYARLASRFGVDAPVEAVVAGFHRAFACAPGLAFGPGRRAEELRRMERRWWREVVAETFEGLGTFANFDGYFEVLFAFFGDPSNWSADPEAPIVLGALKERGLVLGVISNFDYRLYHILEGLGLRSFFDSVTISSEAGFAKPAPQLFRIALSKHSIEPRESVHIGDSERLDLEGAAGAGIHAVLLDRGCRGAIVARDGRARIGSLANILEVAQRFGLA
jgi:putative hydrolase of the HAD superfamily